MKRKYYSIFFKNTEKSLLIKNKLEMILDENEWLHDDDKSEYIFVIGGDGTFLKYSSKYKNKKVVVINGGNLGYFSYFNKKNIKSILSKIKNINAFQEILLLELSLDGKKYYAINELYIRCNHTLDVDIYLDSTKLQHFKGTGLMFSTPLGSTGHSKSAGGGIIFYSEKMIQMLEIHPITQKNFSTLKSPIILNKDIVIDIKNNAQSDGDIIVDGNIIKSKFNKSLTIQSVNSSFKLYLPNSNKIYIDKLKKSFTLEK